MGCALSCRRRAHATRVWPAGESGEDFVHRPISGSAFVHRRIQGSCFVHLTIPGSRFGRLTIPGSHLVHRRIQGSCFVRSGPFFAPRWIGAEPWLRGWPKPEPGVRAAVLRWPQRDPPVRAERDYEEIGFASCPSVDLGFGFRPLADSGFVLRPSDDPGFALWPFRAVFRPQTDRGRTLVARMDRTRTIDALRSSRWPKSEPGMRAATVWWAVGCSCAGGSGLQPRGGLRPRRSGRTIRMGIRCGSR